MKALIYGAVCAFGLLGAVGAQAHDHGYGRGGWHDRGWERGWHRDRDDGYYRPHGYRDYAYGPRFSPPLPPPPPFMLPRPYGWREGYYREAYPRYRGYDYPRRGGAEVVLSFPLY